jgi:hypothetical protein
VIKIPTSRWILYDAVKFNDKVTDPDVPMILQERAPRRSGIHPPVGARLR